MYRATFKVIGMADLMFGRHVTEPKKDSETHAQFEQRTWQHKVPMTDDGQCFLNPFAVTNSLVEAAGWLKRKVDGRSMFKGRFQSGVNPDGKVLLFGPKGKPLTIKNVEPIMLFVPSDGRHGGPKRVERIFPTVHDWSAYGSVVVWDGKITTEQFSDHLEAVGQFVGWGSMRVANGGINGRFRVESVEFEELA